MHCEGVLIADARKTEPLAARGKPQGAKHKAGRSRGAPPELPVGTITRLRKPQQTYTLKTLRRLLDLGPIHTG